MKFPSIPADASDETRLAHAAFAVSLITAQFARAGTALSAEGWAAMLAPVIDMYGQGDSPAAEWIRDGLKAPIA